MRFVRYIAVKFEAWRQKSLANVQEQIAWCESTIAMCRREMQTAFRPDGPGNVRAMALSGRKLRSLRRRERFLERLASAG